MSKAEWTIAYPGWNYLPAVGTTMHYLKWHGSLVLRSGEGWCFVSRTSGRRMPVEVAK